jgi:tRNA threonylcarbamoyladenosine biosynthesis protein TsaB
MRALAIDTVTEMCSVALLVDGKLIERQELAINRHSNVVLGMIDQLLVEAEISLSQLDLIVNDVGPGSFTGIRIGMGVAQGLAYGASVPLVGVDALSSLARGVQADRLEDVFAAIDARMGQVYYALFKRDADTLCLDGRLHLSDPARIEANSKCVHGVGSGWDTYEEVLQEQFDKVAVSQGQFPLAKDTMALGLQRPESDWVDAGDLLPVYLRDDVAKVSLKKKL